MCTSVHVYVRALIRDCRAHRVRNCDTLLCHTRDSGLLYITTANLNKKLLKKFLAVDHSAHMSMKDAAKCER